MSALVASGPAHTARAIPRIAGDGKLVLLGTGTVGGAFVARCLQLQQRGVVLPGFALITNSRMTATVTGGVQAALQRAATAPREPRARPLDNGALRRGNIVVDATASDAVAAEHAGWLARGVHVVTANKLGLGAEWLRAQAIDAARHEGRAHYGDAATVGAGLPVLPSIRALVHGGDRIHRIEGVLSGSLAWLFDQYDGSRPFSELLRTAREAGYTEPDPRIDLSGEDVRRKLLILARAAGWPLQAQDIVVDSLLPARLATAAASDAELHLQVLDAPLRERFDRARCLGASLCFVGLVERTGAGSCRASVGLRALQDRHPLCGGSGTDNRVAIHSDRYRQQPLLIQGPGAGAEVTAAALLDDVLRIAGGGRGRGAAASAINP